MLTCWGHVRMPIEAEPKHLRLGEIPRDAATQNWTVSLYRGEGGPIHPVVLAGRLKFVDAQICEIEPGEQYDLEITLSPPFPNFPGGKFNDIIYIETGVVESPNIIFRVRGTVRQRLMAVPDRLTFPVDRATEVTKTLRLKWDSGERSDILSAKTNIPDATVTTRESTTGAQLVDVTIPAGARPAGRSHLVTITTSDRSVATLSVPISFSKRSSTSQPVIRPTRPNVKP